MPTASEYFLLFTNIIEGTADDETIYGTTANDLILGGAGNDILYGDPITADGGTGLNDTDLLIGGEGNDTLIGGIGNDLLAGDIGDDVLDGGGGTEDVALYLNDRSQYNITQNLDGSFTITALAGGTEGTDIVSNVENFTFGGLSGVNYTAAELVAVAPIAQNDSANVARGAAVVVAVLGNDTDTNNVGEQAAGTVAIQTGPEFGTAIVNPDGTITYTADANFLGESEFTYTVTDSTGLVSNVATVLVDVGVSDGDIVGTEGDDIIKGRKNDDDVINALGGNDDVNGKAGDDLINGGNGNDTIDGGAGNDRLFGGAGNDELSGGGGVDDLHGGAGDDTLKGNGSSDTLFGDAGNDTILGNGGSDIMYGGIGNDTITGGGGCDVIYGDAGNDTILGNGGADLLYGGDGNDTITGGGSVDQIFGDAGADLLTGKGGDDVFVLNNSDYLAGVVDRITDFKTCHDDINISVLGLTASALVANYNSGTGITTLSSSGHAVVEIVGNYTINNADFI